MKILYLHGLGSFPKLEKIKILEQFGDEIIGPHLEYEKKPLFGDLSKLIREEKINAIVGSSTGSYLGFYLSTIYKIPALLFNPAFKEDIEKLQSVPDLIKKENIYPAKMIVLGKEDDIVDWKKTAEMVKGKISKLILVPGMGHRVRTAELEKYFKKFKEEFKS